MADDLKVVAEISVKDDFTGPASKALKRVSNDTRKLAAEEARGANSARTIGEALAQVDRRGEAAARSVGGVAQALARAGHTPFTSAAAQMQNLQQATGKTCREMAALLKVANKTGWAVGTGVRMAGNVVTSAGAQIGGALVTARSLAHVADMDSRYAAFKADANMSKEQAAAFKARVQGAAAASHVREADVMTLAEVMHAVAGNKGFSPANLDIFAKAQKGSGAGAEDMGALAGLMLRMGIKDRAETERSISGAMSLGDRGGFTLRDFAATGASPHPSTRHTGAQAPAPCLSLPRPCRSRARARAARMRRGARSIPSSRTLSPGLKKAPRPRTASMFLMRTAICALSLIYKRR